MKETFPKLIIVAPAYNEEQDIPTWFNALSHVSWNKYIKRVILVDDGSTDKTVSVAQKQRRNLPLTVIGYSKNGGPGKAFRKGLIESLNIADTGDVIVTMECDNTSDLSILPNMIDSLNRGASVCVASYYARGGGFEHVSWWRMFISEVGNLFIRTACGIKDVKTFSSFYRVFTTESLRKLRKRTHGLLFRENSFACMVELLARYSSQGEKLSEVPMILIGSQRKGKSKMKIVPTVIGYFRVVLQYRR